MLRKPSSPQRPRGIPKGSRGAMAGTAHVALVAAALALNLEACSVAATKCKVGSDCESGVCDAKDNKCGLADGDGPCANGEECRDLKCDMATITPCCAAMDDSCGR